LVLVVEAETPADDLGFDLAERAEQALHLVRPLLVGEAVVRRERVFLDQKVDEAAAVFVAHGAVERKRRVRVEIPHLVELVPRYARLLFELLDRARTAGARDDRLRGARG